MRNLLGKGKRTVKVKFLGEMVEVTKLSVAQVEDFQEKLQSLQKADGEEDPKRGLEIQRDIIRMGVVGADDLTDEELNSFPLDDISKLAQEVLKAAGIGEDRKGNG